MKKACWNSDSLGAFFAFIRDMTVEKWQEMTGGMRNDQTLIWDVAVFGLHLKPNSTLKRQLFKQYLCICDFVYEKSHNINVCYDLM